MIEVLLILLALGLVVACGAFVAAEFALVTVDRAAVDRAVEEGDRGARGVSSALKTLSTQLSGAQLGITVTNLLIGYMAEPSIARLLDGPLEDLGLAAGAADGVSIAVALTLATAVTMLFGELVPKNLAIAAPLQTARAVQGFMRGFTHSTAILITAFNGTANRILRRMGIEPQEELASARSPEELSSLVQRSADQGTLEPETATLLQRSLSFGDRRAADVMTPQRRVHTLRNDAPVRTVLEMARSTGRSRFPVMDSAGDVVGGVHVKHAFSVPNDQRDCVPVSEVMVEPVMVPATLELDPLMAVLRKGGLQMAVVVDEWGNVDGIVTLEDLIEEIVGDVRDEHDPTNDSIAREGDRRWNLSGLLRPDEVQDVLGLIVPEDDEYDTLAGLFAFYLEQMPALGAHVAIEMRDTAGALQQVTLTVRRMDHLRVDRIRLETEELEPPPPEEDEE